MSAVLNFFKEHPSEMDDLHKIIAKVPDLQAQLPPIRQALLSCCGAVPGKNGEIKLVVADLDRWDKLSTEQATITGKIEAINRMVEELDAIFAEIEAEGIDCSTKTLMGICGVETGHRTPVIDPKTGTDHDSWGHKIPAKQDPRFVSWMQRAEKAMAGL